MNTLLAISILGTLLQVRGEGDRHGRGDVRNVLSDPDPGFWPTRGRRASSSSEEVLPPFWANRGRRWPILEAPTPIKSRIARQCVHKQGSESPLYADEPHWVLTERRDGEGLREDRGADDVPFWVTRGRRGDATRALAELSGDQFWPVRGKRGVL